LSGAGGRNYAFTETRRQHARFVYRQNTTSHDAVSDDLQLCVLDSSNARPQQGTAEAIEVLGNRAITTQK
jgi:hypothetical protein